MPDIPQRIAEWRHSMETHLQGREDVLDELESHLWEVVEELENSGVPTQEAFWKARNRLGFPHTVAAEFAKVPPTALPWLPIRLVWGGGALLMVFIVGPLILKLAAGGLSTLLAAHMGMVMLGYIATLIVGFLSVSYLLTRLFHDLQSGQKESLKRAVLLWSGVSVFLTGTGIVLGSFCPFEKTGWCFGLTTHEVGGIAILLWSMVMLAGYWRFRQTMKTQITMLFGIAGNIVVVLGWFGAMLGSRHAGGLLASYSVVVALLASQAAVSFTAFAPAGCLMARRAE